MLYGIKLAETVQFGVAIVQSLVNSKKSYPKLLTKFLT